MNNDFDFISAHPVQTFLYAIAVAILGAFGIGPLRALSRRIQTRGETGAVADASDQLNIRRGDSMADTYQILATRAMTEKDAAINEKNLGIAAAQKELHEFRNSAQAEIARVTVESIAKMGAAEERAVKAEARAASAEDRAQRAEDQIIELRREIGRLSRRIDALTGYNGTRTEVEGG